VNLLHVHVCNTNNDGRLVPLVSRLMLILQTVGVAGLGLSLMYMLQEKLVRICAPCPFHCTCSPVDMTYA
jgi:hypothetical protein